MDILAAEPGTLVGDITQRLREKITDCSLAPGQKLRFEQLRAEYGVSYGTLREALSILASESLVTAESQRGFRVAPVSASNLVDITNVRVMVEREALRMSIARGGDEWEDRLLIAFRRMERVEQRQGEEYTGTSEWMSAHGAFHETLLSACGSPTLLAIQANLFGLSHRYRRLSALIRHSTAGKGKRSDEHKLLLDAATRRDADTACDALERHIRQTSDDVMRGMTDNWPEGQ